MTLLVRKLESISCLSNEERQAILSLPLRTQVLQARQEIVCDGDTPSQCCIILDGWAYRYMLLGEARRQIIAFHVAGDIPDLQSLHLRAMDHSIGILTQAKVAFIPHDALRALIARFPAFGAALWRDTLIDAGIFREYVTDIGRRSAYQRLCHLFCELYAKQEAIGLVQDQSCPLPVTQADLADATGLTSVHINRTLKEMRARGLITLRSGKLTISSWSALTAAADLNPAYLRTEPQAARALDRKDVPSGTGNPGAEAYVLHAP